MRTTQLDMFGPDQGELPDATPSVVGADPQRVRQRLQGMLAEVRAADARTLRPARRRFMETVVPQMSKWLPEDEARHVCMQFAEEMARFG